jgi:DNA-binding transcriptional regulator GbsR (MarR family)
MTALILKMAVPSQSPETLPEWRIAMIDLFVGGALLIGLPKSVGQIYGYLYSAVEPAPMDKIIADLAISKGSASQGLKFLRQLGAVKSKFVVGDRRDHFIAEVKSKKLMGGFIREKLTPALEEGVDRLTFVRDMMGKDGLLDDETHLAKVVKLETWHKKLKISLPVLVKFLD